MATYDEVMTALRNADAAGASDDARQLAQIAQRMKGQEKPEAEVKPHVDLQPKTWADVFKKVGLSPKMDVGANISRSAYEAGGRVTDVISGMGAPPWAAAGAGAIANAGIESIPMLLGGGIGAKVGGGATTALKSGLERGGKELMQSALKPTKAELRTGKAAKAIQTMLDEGVNVTPGGVEKLKTKIDSLNTEIQNAISASTSTVDKMEVAKRVKDVIDRFKMQVTPQSDLNTIRKAFRDFIDNPLIKNVSNIPVQLAQKLKTGTYRALGSKSYGELKGAEIETQKALARGLKEEIAKAVPGIAQLNARESELLNAEALAVSRVMMDANKNPMGLGWLAAHPATWIGFAADRSPLIKSLLARAAYSTSKMPVAVGQGIGAGAGAGFAGMLESSRQQQ